MDIETLVRQGTAVNLVSAACLTLLLYDHAITLDQEIEKMWPTRLSIAKALFFMNRYLVEAMLLFNCVSAARPHLSPDLCILYAVAYSCINSVYQCRSGYTRIACLGSTRNKWAIYIAYFFYFGGTVTLIGLVVKDYIGEEVLIDQSLDSLPGCYATSVPSIIAGFWIGPLIVESVLFLLVISRAVVWWKDGIAAPRILYLLARDSTVYFTVVFALLLANYLVFELGPPFLSSLLVTPSTTAGCILGSHMLLNLRAMTELTNEEVMSIKTGGNIEMQPHFRRTATSTFIPTYHQTEAPWVNHDVKLTLPS